MAHRVAIAALLLAALVVLPFRPLIALLIFAVALAVVLHRRGLFGSGMYRSVLAFNASLPLTVLGVVTSLIGLIPFGDSCNPGPCTGNFLLLPGLLVLGTGITLFAWSVARMLRARR